MRSPGTAGAALFGYATTIACTRVYTQDHTVPQIVVGAMLGAGCAIVNENLFGEKRTLFHFICLFHGHRCVGGRQQTWAGSIRPLAWGGAVFLLG